MRLTEYCYYRECSSVHPSLGQDLEVCDMSTASVKHVFTVTIGRLSSCVNALIAHSAYVLLL